MSNVLKEMRGKTSIFDYLVSYRLFVRYFDSIYQNEKCTKCLSKSTDVILLYQKNIRLCSEMMIQSTFRNNSLVLKML